MSSAKQLFTTAWKNATQQSVPPTIATGFLKIPYADLVSAIEKEDAQFISEFVRSFYSGVVYIFTDAFDPKDLAKLKNAAFAWAKNQPSGEHKIIEKLPDYRSRRDWHMEEQGEGYSSTYDMMHYFRWNDDPIGAYKLFEPKYRILRAISGYDPEDIKFNSPADGVVDRVEVSHYPTGVGGIAFHTDPLEVTRFAFTCNLSRFGKDYKRGGFAVGTGNGKVMAIDPMLDVGSLTGFMPTICHGVEIIDPHLPASWDSIAGRWYGAISMVTTHMIKNRNFTRPVAGYPTLREQIASAKMEKKQ